MAYDRLALYNGALRICGERSLASLTEAREPRYILDELWSAGAVDAVLEQGQWNFALNSVLIDHDPAVTPQFGYRFAFSKPDDYVRTTAVCSDEYYKSPLIQYQDETDYLFADIDPVYVRYVSNRSDLGGDLSKWPGSFAEYAEAYFASHLIYKITSDKDRIQLAERNETRCKRDALNKDAMKDPTTFPAPGSWVRARYGTTSSRRDGGSRNQLIG